MLNGPVPNRSKVNRKVTARIPLAAGDFRLSLYHNGDDGKEHLALIRGKVGDRPGVMVRIHSECFTGDVMGSRRCDCGEQLRRATEMIEREGCGAIVYLRQEGRGIGLLKKLEAYNLQDLGYDTVDANRLLGHAPDERDYSLAAGILDDLGVRSIRLLTNNPAKIAGLQAHGIEVRERLPIPVQVSAENAAYLRTKVDRLHHRLDLGALAETLAEPRSPTPWELLTSPSPESADGPWLPDVAALGEPPRGRPFVTLTYAQSVDGCIAARAGQPLALSGAESMTLTHRLRAAHDAILVGIGTVLSDDPRLTARLVEARDPRPVILDTRLRFPESARLLGSRPWIVTSEEAETERQAPLEAAGARVLRLPIAAPGRIDLDHLLRTLHGRGVRSVMVEGGAAVISSFLSSRRVDSLVITIAPTLLGGLAAVDRSRNGPGALPRLRRPRYRQLGDDLLVWGAPEWS